mmetsp:Transcript_141573/g.394598  ORF Transcript_141573/g.394598 Transcript_141573/m.394598 type:complete len:404 (-) Transcript_141573:94-1305(-)|eukprot:CAMPEP_0179089934 /NCGR_PEP_ID=MMETSP0796-20121207/41004_1 /TAXON_ID=73915 /ORGANISM="Pyrodinium bahamense, Strain pbaha01" /LENGTH=403 /DNA_ID=CAMNT_0020787497 /DNA_START=205 /DNA_END=1416 /DNA_ORIENTATION=+
MRQTQWVDPGASAALCWLAIDDRKGNPRRAHCSLPPCLYTDGIAPFLRFNGPQPNQLYAVGGRDQQQDPLDIVEMFDTWHGRWVTCPRMLARRAGCAAAPLPDGRLMVVGGYDEKGIVDGLLATCEVFDPVRQAWSTDRARLERARWGHGCAPLRGLIYTVGGCSLRPGAPAREAHMETLRSCEAYDPESGTWAASADLHVARAGARVVALSDRHLAVVGGCDDVFGRAELLPSVELFDGQAGRWSILDLQLSTPRTTAAAAALDERQILIVGGAPSLASAEVYALPKLGTNGEQVCEDPAPRRPARSTVCEMAEGRMGCQAATMSLPAPGRTFPLCTRRCIVVVGGENGDEDLDSSLRQFSSVLVYDAEEECWQPEESFPPIPTPRTAMALVVAPGTVIGHP